MLKIIAAAIFSLLVIPAYPTPISLKQGDRLEVWVPWNERLQNGGEWLELAVDDGRLRTKSGGFLHDGTLPWYVWRRL